MQSNEETSRSKTEMQHEKCQAIVRERRKKREQDRCDDLKRLKNWGRGDRTQALKEVFIYDKF